MQAAEILNCSLIDLRAQENQAELMQIAFSYQIGKSDGEYLRELNPDFQKEMKKRGEAIEEARKRNGKTNK